MNVFEIGAQDGIGALRASQRPQPVPGPGEAVLRVKAVCLNHRDMLVLSGTYGARRPETRVPVSDGVGEVSAIGPGVTGVAVGDRATCAHFVSWLGGPFAMSAFAHDLGVTHDGWLAEYILIPAAALVKVPEALSDDQAAALPAAGLTAWNAIVEVGKVKAGDLVLTLGAGGVSIFALQIAKMSGAKVAITSSSEAKLARARELGADITINYATIPDWPAEMLVQSGGAGADIIVETGGITTLPQSIAAAAPNARIVLIGALAGPADKAPANFSTIIGKNLTLSGITEGSRDMLRDFVRAAAASGLAPVVDRVFDFDEAPEAYAYLKSGQHLGKVMIRVAR
jgi:NADPH:quinone reductase-like Zn-dependent oxidoreductase